MTNIKKGNEFEIDEKKLFNTLKNIEIPEVEIEKEMLQKVIRTINTTIKNKTNENLIIKSNKQLNPFN